MKQTILDTLAAIANRALDLASKNDCRSFGRKEIAKEAAHYRNNLLAAVGEYEETCAIRAARRFLSPRALPEYKDLIPAEVDPLCFA